MKLFIAAMITVLGSGCHEHHTSKIVRDNFDRRRNEPSYTVIVDHDECTDCLDVYILEGTVGVPKDLQAIFGDTLSSMDMLLVGNFPADLINPTKFFFNPSLNFRVTGKLIGVDYHNLNSSKAPIFYVEKWEKIKPR
jgi:hypothetical protein